MVEEQVIRPNTFQICMVFCLQNCPGGWRSCIIVRALYCQHFEFRYYQFVHLFVARLPLNMDSDPGNDIFITQSNTRENPASDEADLDPFNILFDVGGGYNDAGDAVYQMKSRNAPYGIEFSDVSDDELLICTCQDAEESYEKRFGDKPVAEEEVLAKGMKRRVFCC